MSLKIYPKVKIVSRSFVVLVCVSFIITNANMSVYADTATTLPESEIQAVNEYPNWVASDCPSGFTTSNSSTSVNDVYILGDSITADTGSDYTADFPSAAVDIDAADGRSLDTPGSTSGATAPTTANDTGLQAITDDASEIKQAQAVVIALGTNGSDTTQNIDKAVEEVRSENAGVKIYWVDTFQNNATSAVQKNVAQSNAAIYQQTSQDKYYVISWSAVVDPSMNPQTPKSNTTDANNYIDTSSSGLGYNPDAKGSLALANAVSGAVNSGYTGTGSAPTCSCPTSSTGTTGGSDTTGGSSSIGLPTLTGSTPADQAYNYYVSQGLSPIAASGLVGNFMEESGGNTEQISPSALNSNGATGIAQWLGGRLTNLQNFASSHNSSVDSLPLQLAFSWSELTGAYSSVLSSLKAATTPSQAADIVNSDGPPSYGGGYEGSGVAPTQREANAISIYQKYGGGGGGGGTTGTTGTTGCAGSTTTGTGTSGSVGTTTTTDSYEDPLRAIEANHTIFSRRIDQGVDYGGKGPIYAIGDGKVDTVYKYGQDSGWPGPGGNDVGGWVSYTLSNGPAAGKIVYFAEACQPTVTVGQSVTPSTVICQMNGEVYPWIETGWASGDGTNTMAKECWDQVSSNFGVNFSQLLTKLGAPAGITQEPNPPCTLPSGWPTW